MKRLKFLKLKAFLQIFLVITLSVFVSLQFASLNSPSVYAENNVCCEKTVNGDFCQYTTEDQCASGSQKALTTCEQTPFCKPVCCDKSATGQGCFANVGGAACSNSGGNVINDASCNVAQCNTGCCVVGNQCSLQTESSCRGLVSNFPALPYDFRADVNGELECANICLDKTTSGCCVSSDGVCKAGGRDDCEFSGGEFFSASCSGVAQCSSCQGEKSYQCVDGSSDVHVFDSCGNDEGVYEKCDYSQGKICGDVSGVAKCIDINCATTWDNPVVSGDGGPRKNGESWCEYDANAGPTIDLPGSRHFRHYCYNGEEIVEECRDYRDEICISGKVVDSDTGEETSYAACKKNRGKDCGVCTDKYCCENSDVRDCVWLSPNNEDVQEVADNYQAGNNEDRQVDVSVNEEGGVCIPLVPLGLKFWEQDGGVQGNGGGAICDNWDFKSGGKQEPVQVFWEQIHEWDCEANCQAYTPEFAETMNNMCNAYGDCGAKYNLAGAWSSGGFKREVDRLTNAPDDVDDGVPDLGDVNDENLFSTHPEYDKDESAKILMENAKDFISDPGNYAREWAYYKNGLDLGDLFIPTNADAAEISFRNILLIIGGSSAALLGIGVGIASLAGLVSIEAVGWSAVTALFSSAAWVGGAAVLVGTIATVLVIVAVIVLGLVYYSYDSYPASIPIECNMWQQPRGGDYCGLCNEAGVRADGVEVDYTAGGLHDCTEYLCKSLGSGCKFINSDEGTKCVSEVCEGVNADVNKPLISVDASSLLSGAKCVDALENGNDVPCVIEDNINGLTISPYVKPFNDISFSLETYKTSGGESDYSDCRWSKTRSANINEMSGVFSNQDVNNNDVLSSKHGLNLSAAADLNPGEDESYFVRCQDTCGNGADSPEFEVKFTVGNAPDLTPPVLVSVSPSSGSAVANNVESKDVQLVMSERLVGGGFVNSTARPGCRWDKLDLSYQEMDVANSFICPSPVSGEQQTCNVNLPISENEENRFFFRCRDIAGNENKQSLIDGGFLLRKSDALNITSVKCVNDYGNDCNEIYSRNFTLQAFTSLGSDNGKAVCGLSTRNVSNSDETDFLFFETDSSSHSITLGPLDARNYSYYVVCDDKAGNAAKQKVEFNVIDDKSVPVILSVSRGDGDIVNVRTNKISSCKYSVDSAAGDFDFENADVLTTNDGFVHSGSVEQDVKRIVIVCEDRFGNRNSGTNVYVL